MACKNLKKNIVFLTRLNKARTVKQLVSILNNASKEQIDFLVQIATNVCAGNCPIQREKFQNLCQYKKYIRALARAKTTRGAAKVIQRGGALPLLALAGSLALPILKNLAEEAISQGVPLLHEKALPFLKDAGSDLVDFAGDAANKLSDFAGDTANKISNFFGNLF